MDTEPVQPDADTLALIVAPGSVRPRPVPTVPPGESAIRAGNAGTASARAVALRALEAVDAGAYANLALPAMLRSVEKTGSMTPRDRAFATELTYGSIRMRRACDWVIDQHASRATDPGTRRVLRLGVYQLVYLRTPPHAAVSATVDLAPIRSRGFVNAVLRKVADGSDPVWPDVATELSYPDWIVERLNKDLGELTAMQVLLSMNEPARVTRRVDGYVQDVASQFVGEFLGAQPGELVLDLCAAPGGKATAAATSGATVFAADIHRHRAALIAQNAATLGLTDRVLPVVCDGRCAPFPNETFERVLVDAPCSGLGSLRRRPDARWRIHESDLSGLVTLQRDLLRAAADLVRVGGWIVYSACTLTLAESVVIDSWAKQQLPQLEAGPRPQGYGWEPLGRGSRLLPRDTDGMVCFTYRRVA